MGIFNDKTKYIDAAIVLGGLCILLWILKSDAWELLIPLVPALVVAHIGFKGQLAQISSHEANIQAEKLEKELFVLNKLTILVNEIIDNLLVIKGNYSEALEGNQSFKRTLEVPYLACLPENFLAYSDSAVEASFLIRFIPCEQLQRSINQMEEPYSHFYPANISNHIAQYGRVIQLWHKRNRLYEDSIFEMMEVQGESGESIIRPVNGHQKNDLMNYLLISEECVKHTDLLVKEFCEISNALGRTVAQNYVQDNDEQRVLKILYEFRGAGWITPLTNEEKQKILLIPAE